MSDYSYILYTFAAKIRKSIGCYDVYTVDGMKVRTKANSLDGVKGSVYIINGKKVSVK